MSERIYVIEAHHKLDLLSAALDKKLDTLSHGTGIKLGKVAAKYRNK